MSNRLLIALKALIAETDLDKRVQAVEQGIIQIHQRLDAMGTKLRQTHTRKRDRMTSQEVADELGIWKGSVSALVQMGKITPANPDALNGSPLFYDRAHINNFKRDYSSGEITRLLSEYRHRPRKPRLKRAS